jgi:hypothetical protein
MRRHLLTLASVTLVAAAIAMGITVRFIGDLLGARPRLRARGRGRAPGRRGRLAADCSVFATDEEPIAFHMYWRILAGLRFPAHQLGVSMTRWYLPAPVRPVAIRAAVVIGFLLVVVNIVRWGDTFVWSP